MVFVYRDTSQSNLQEIYDDLCELRDVAEELNITPWRIRRWLERRDEIRCPLPVRRLASGHLYSMAEWKAWFQVWTSTRGLDGRRGPKRKKKEPELDMSFNSGSWR